MKSHKLTYAVMVMLVTALALGAYVLHLKRSAEQPPAPAQSQTISVPVMGRPTTVKLFQANDQDGSLYERTATVALPEGRSDRAREILRALVAQDQEQASPHPLAAGGEIHEVYLLNNNLAIVDVNSEFVQGHRSGILVEALTLGSMAQTLAANLPGITRMKVLVDGKERATLAGHADLIEPYDVSSAAALVKPESSGAATR